jgi:protein TonB
MNASVVLPPAAPEPPPPAPIKRIQTQEAAPPSTNAAPVEAASVIGPERVDGSRDLDVLASLPGTVAGVPEALPPAAPPPPPQLAISKEPVPVGGEVNPPVKIKDVRPAYPAIAQAAGVQGVVIIQAVIDPSGQVVDTKVLRSHPLLEAAALDAVRQWEYSPTLLNGQPISVVMTVTVNFALRR